MVLKLPITTTLQDPNVGIGAKSKNSSGVVTSIQTVTMEDAKGIVPLVAKFGGMKMDTDTFTTVVTPIHEIFPNSPDSFLTYIV